MNACSGWLIGDEGHFMTNNHCIADQSDADNTDYEFMAEGDDCSSECNDWFACGGTIEAASGTLVQTDQDLDYSLIELPTNLSEEYGYLQLRNTVPAIGGFVYIPQHPSGWGKQLAVELDDGTECEIESTDEDACFGGPGDLGYMCDTMGGSSGSPVLSRGDHLVVGLHHCANCPNRAVPIPSIIADLGEELPSSAIPADTRSVTGNHVHGSHFERRDQHEFYLVSAYPLTVKGRLTYQWDNVRDPGPSSFIRRLNVFNEANFPITFRLDVDPVPLEDIEYSVELDTTASVGANGKHGFHFERRDRHEFYLVSVYPTTTNGRVTYEWDNVRDPGASAFIRRLNVINKSNFPVEFKLKVVSVVPENPPSFGAGLVQTDQFEETSSVDPNAEHGFHFERRDRHQFYLEHLTKP